MPDFKYSLQVLLFPYNNRPALKHGLEQALINLICNERKITIAELLNLKLKKGIRVNAAIGFLKPEEAASLALQFVKEGFKTLKIKTGRENFEDDFTTINSIKKVVGEDKMLRIETNCKWTLDEAIKNLNRLEQFSIKYAEQPVNSIEEFQELKMKTSVPLAADESIRNFETAKNFIADKIVDFVILKQM